MECEESKIYIHPDILFNILTFLPAKSVLTSSLVNKEWNYWSKSELLWKELCENRFGERRFSKYFRDIPLSATFFEKYKFAITRMYTTNIDLVKYAEKKNDSRMKSYIDFLEKLDEKLKNIPAKSDTYSRLMRFKGIFQCKIAELLLIDGYFAEAKNLFQPSQYVEVLLSSSSLRYLLIKVFPLRAFASSALQQYQDAAKTCEEGLTVLSKILEQQPSQNMFFETEVLLKCLLVEALRRLMKWEAMGSMMNNVFAMCNKIEKLDESVMRNLNGILKCVAKGPAPCKYQMEKYKIYENYKKLIDRIQKRK